MALTELKKLERGAELNLTSPAKANGCASLVFFTFFLVVSFLSVGILYFKDIREGLSLYDIVMSPVTGFAISTLFLTYVHCKNWFADNVAPQSPLVYSPTRLFRKTLLQNLNWLVTYIFIGWVFLTEWTFSPDPQSTFNVFQVVVIPFMILLGLIIPGRMLFYYIAKKGERTFGESRLKILSPPGNIQVGDLVTFQISNAFFNRTITSVECILRNIREEVVTEKFLADGPGKEKVFASVYYEQKKTLDIDDQHGCVQFLIPEDGRFITDYQKREPVYWELEVSNEQVGYSARFYPEVSGVG